MEATADHYATLRVDPGADSKVIRRAYRDLMRRYHPDVNSSDDAAKKATAINEAYACLRDPEGRAAYDRRRNSPPTSESSATAARPRRHRPSVRRAQQAYIVKARPRFELSWPSAASFGFATLVTIITFTITSATPSAAPAPAAVITMETHVDGQGLSGAVDTDCEPSATTANDACRTNSMPIAD